MSKSGLDLNAELYRNDSGLFGYVLTWPAEISAVQSQCSEFLVSSSYTDFVDTFCADAGIGWLTTEFKLSLFAVRGALSTSCGTLVTGVTGDTHPRQELVFASMIVRSWW
jgi:hypothetical protein